MIRLSGRAVIARNGSDVSAFLADVRNEPKWQRDIVHVQLVAGAGGETGAKYERVQVVGGRNIKTVNEVVELQEGTRVVFDAKGKVIEYRLEYGLRPMDGGTEVAMRLEGEMLGFASMFEGVAQDELKAAIPENMARLQAALETP